jgi:hypothetical protein
MKRLSYALPLFTLLLISIYSFVPVTPTEPTQAIPPALEKTFKRYGIKSGIITYKVTGINTGTETIYFDQYGMREAKYSQTESNVFGMKTQNNGLSLLIGIQQYEIDLTAKTGTHLVNPILEKIVENGEDLGEVGEQMLIDMGGEKLGTEEFMGKTCDKWTVSSMAADMLIYKQMTLKMHSSIMGLTLDIEVTDLKENVAIPEEKFTIPEGITLQDINLEGE